ncbi:MAG: hypothetical protein HQM13_17750 [SAR324 cluster bacterium]|nr:hypothetical protein [SAR324 cluster bacterium]
MAILDAKSAHQLLPKYPEIAVISILWPNVLFVISHQLDIEKIQISTPKTIHIHENSDYFVTTWSKLLSSQNYKPDQFHWFHSEESQEILLNLKEGFFLMTAPYLLKELRQLLNTDTSYRLIPIDEMLLSGNQQHYPWLVTSFLPDNLYPSTPQPLPMLTSYPVLVARADTDSYFIEKVLTVLFSQRDLIQPHVLFRFLDPQKNQLFKNYPFHRVSKQSFKL